MAHLTTHRLIQIHNLRDHAESEVSRLIRAAANARRINNRKAQAHFLSNAAQFQSIAFRATRRLAA